MAKGFTELSQRSSVPVFHAMLLTISRKKTMFYIPSKTLSPKGQQEYFLPFCYFNKFDLPNDEKKKIISTLIKLKLSEAYFLPNNKLVRKMWNYSSMHFPRTAVVLPSTFEVFSLLIQ